MTQSGITKKHTDKVKMGGSLSGTRIQLNQSQIKMALDEAAALFNTGNFEDAGVIYKRILQDDPNDSDALNLPRATVINLDSAPQILLNPLYDTLPITHSFLLIQRNCRVPRTIFSID